MSAKRQTKQEQIVRPFIMKLKREHSNFYKNNYKHVLNIAQRGCYYDNESLYFYILKEDEKKLKERTDLTKYGMKRVQQTLHERYYAKLRAMLEYISENPDMNLATEFEFDD